MPVSRDISDHNFNAIEVAIRGTARGRAFLASYARRVRRSDTLTLLAMLNRLEQLCQEQAARVAELDGWRTPVAPDDRAGAGRADESNDRRFSGVSEFSHAHGLSGFSDTLDFIVSKDQRVERKSTAAFLNREAAHRIQELAETISELDRKTTRLGEGVASSAQAVTGHLLHDDGERREVVASMERRSIDNEVPVQETNVLDDIAKALGSTTTP